MERHRPIQSHELKVWPGLFEDLLLAGKRFEVRRNDRGFQVQDELRLREWRPDWRGSPASSQLKPASDLASAASGSYTGRELLAKIVYIAKCDDLPGHPLAAGYVVLGIEPLDPTRWRTS